LPYCKFRITNEQAYRQQNYDLRLISFVPGQQAKNKFEAYNHNREIINSPELKNKIEQHALELQEEFKKIENQRSIPPPIIQEKSEPASLREVTEFLGTSESFKNALKKSETHDDLIIHEDDETFSKEKKRLSGISKNTTSSPVKTSKSPFSIFKRHRENHIGQKKILESSQDTRINALLYKNQLLYYDEHGKISSLPKGLPNQYLMTNGQGKLEWVFLSVDMIQDEATKKEYNKTKVKFA
jgi:hypothetical protein